MTYDDIAAIFLSPLDEPIPEPDVTTTPARRLRDSLEPIATQGWWSRAAGERLTELGVDFFPGYVWGRAAALGTPSAALVAATFGVFDPGLIGAVYEAGAAGASRDEILAARAAGGEASVGSVATDDECAALAEPLLEALGGLDGLGRALFAALRSLPLPTSPSGRLWRAAELVREHRGDSHLAALVGRRPRRRRGQRADRALARLRSRRVQRHSWFRSRRTRRRGRTSRGEGLDGGTRADRRRSSFVCRHRGGNRRRAGSADHCAGLPTR